MYYVYIYIYMYAYILMVVMIKYDKTMFTSKNLAFYYGDGTSQETFATTHARRGAEELPEWSNPRSNWPGTNIQYMELRSKHFQVQHLRFRKSI